MRKFFISCLLSLTCAAFATEYKVQKSITQNGVTAAINLSVYHYGLHLGRIHGNISILDTELSLQYANFPMTYSKNYLSTVNHVLSCVNQGDIFSEIEVDLSLDSTIKMHGQKIYITVYYEDQEFKFTHNMLEGITNPAPNVHRPAGWMDGARNSDPSESYFGNWLAPGKTEDNPFKAKPKSATGWGGH